MQKHSKIKIGISSCLLGEEVRFDGGHKRDRFITDRLAAYVTFVPICPEVGVGMGIPREPIKLVGTVDDHRALGVKDKTLDVTEDLVKFADTTATRLDKVSGYIFKSKSPSCGMERVKLYPKSSSMPSRDGIGIYAKRIMELLPDLPVEEEGRLNDPILRENFIERVFVYRRWQDLVAKGVTSARVIEFYTRHKLIVLAHGQRGYKSMGKLVANMDKKSTEGMAKQFISSLMATLKKPATRRGHTNVLQHAQGYLKKTLDKDDKQELAQTIEQYRLGHLPLIVPITLLRHHFRRNPVEYITNQIYMNPHPPELMLRNSL